MRVLIHSILNLPLILFAALLISLPTCAGYPKAPDITLPSQYKTIQLSKLQGKLVYVDFWASWCRPCKKSFPWMVAMKEKFKHRNFEIIAINLDTNKALADEFLASQSINFPVAFDPNAITAEAYGVKGMPSSYLIDSQGLLRIRYTGFWNKSKKEKEQNIQQLLEH